MTQTTQFGCACGQVRLEVERAPIVSVECCCNSCHEAGERMQRLPSAPQILGENGTTRLVLYRKDRVNIVKGADLLRNFRLKPQSKTCRVIASCCNTPVFLDFKSGHWLSLYGSLWPAGTSPPLEMRTMTSDLTDASVLSDDVPNPKRHTFSFFTKLLGAWAAMGFRIPKVAVNGEIDA